MDDREALLGSVFANEDDDAPRLIYADWVEEHGEANFAAFIRAQCGYARAEPQSDEYSAFWHEVLAAWEQLRRDWRSELNGLWKLDATYFRRGFLERPLTLRAEQFAERSPYWWPRMPVRKVTLDVSPWTVEALADSEELARLTELALRGQDPHGTIVPVVAECRYLEGLKVLDLTEFHLGIEAIEALARSSTLRGLTDLRLSYFIRPNREGARLLRKRFGDVCQF